MFIDRLTVDKIGTKKSSAPRSKSAVRAKSHMRDITGRKKHVISLKLRMIFFCE